MDKKPLITIYIPTFNRCYYLRKCLEAITSQDIFCDTDLIEIIISDNASTDETAVYAKEFIDKFGSKIKYICRKPAISADRNIISGIEFANGKYTKLCNDNLIFEDGALDKIVDFLQKKSPDIYFMLNKCWMKKSDEELFNPKNTDEFINTVTFFCTSISCYFFKTEKVRELNDIYRAESLKLTQVDIALRLIDKGAKTYVTNDILFFMAPLFKKGGYNVTEVFGQNYFSLLDEYFQKGTLSNKTFYEERKRTLQKHIIPGHFDLKRKFSFAKGHFLKYLKPCYKDLYFPYVLAKLPLQLFIRQCKVLHKKLTWNDKLEFEQHKKNWSDLNKNNETGPQNLFNPLNVYAGNGCKGMINYIGNKSVVLGKNVIIQDNVRFEPTENIYVPDNTIIKENSVIKTNNDIKETCDIL